MVFQRRLRSMAAAKPVLRGVIFDLDGTLTVPNLDFRLMHARCNVPPHEDLLHAVGQMKDEERRRAEEIIEEMEHEGRRTLQLAPGASELGRWLRGWQLPAAIVTRNTLTTVQHLHEGLWQRLPKFCPAVGREFLPHKPHPAAMELIAKQWGIPLGPELLMVGDSPCNDIAFGKAAGVSTALVDANRAHRDRDATLGADFVVDSLQELPGLLWEHFQLSG
ncbi:unnamed protein product, partial [Effrenium voratum]